MHVVMVRVPSLVYITLYRQQTEASSTNIRPPYTINVLNNAGTRIATFNVWLLRRVNLLHTNMTTAGCRINNTPLNTRNITGSCGEWVVGQTLPPPRSHRYSV